jgi:hypothetical protein
MPTVLVPYDVGAVKPLPCLLFREAAMLQVSVLAGTQKVQDPLTLMALLVTPLLDIVTVAPEVVLTTIFVQAGLLV